MSYTYELNNVRKDVDYFNNDRLTKKSPVAEVFSAMVNGESLDKFGARGNNCVRYIEQLGRRAENGDYSAVAELNTLRRFVVEAPLMQELNILGVFGTYEQLGYDETPERVVYDYVGETARQQANSGDVVFPEVQKRVYQVPTFTVSGGYAVDYRRVSTGDMTIENQGMQRVRTMIMNKAYAAVVTKVYEAIKNATGVKFVVSGDPLTKTGVDSVITKVRRFGKPTVIGDYALLSEFNAWAGYVGKVDTTTVTGISDDIMNELAANGILGMYNGAVLSEMPNAYDFGSVITGSDGNKTFDTIMPTGLGFVIPTGVNSPIATFSRGGLTSFTGNNIKNGKVETRFDLEIGADIAKGHEYQIGVLHDEGLSADL